MSTYYYQKPQQQPARQSNGKVYYQRCNHIISRGDAARFVCVPRLQKARSNYRGI